jgi:uncharacterized protein with NRDE domain
MERERLLSAPFIVSESYGTRSSTVLTIGYDGDIRFFERSFNADGQPVGDVDFGFGWSRRPRRRSDRRE